MIISSISLNNFRNITEEKIFPCDNMNVITGENAQGKTNLLEAIWAFSGAKSFRGSKDQEYIKFGEEKAVISCDFLSENIEKNAKIVFSQKKEAFLNNKKLKNFSDIIGNLNAIVFSPIDLRLVNDGPNIRRRFLDLGIGQLLPSYIEVLKSYNRAIMQRNAIIKDLKYDATVSIMLDIFENEIAAGAKKIIEQRKRYIEKLNYYLPKIYDGISSGKEIIETEYISENEDNLLEKLKISRKEDMYLGVTSIGPHRDDLKFKINGFDARSYASQGQKRSVALSLKLAEAEIIKKNIGEWPICLMDDVMSELDPKRQNFILNHIKEMQVFLTCCDETYAKNLMAGKVFHINKGSVI